MKILVHSLPEGATIYSDGVIERDVCPREGEIIKFSDTGFEYTVVRVEMTDSPVYDYIIYAEVI